jgi:hypothetical protein
MENNKIKIYRMPLSRIFPATHPRRGEETEFAEKIYNALEFQEKGYISFATKDIDKKLHTCRQNYSLWKKRIDEVAEGKAVLVVYEWTGEPYRTPTNNLFVFGNNKATAFIDTLKNDERYIDTIFVFDSGIGVQLLDCDKPFAWEIDGLPLTYQLEMIQLANNDGLSDEDFDKWFDIEKATGQKAIIHFTKFRY